MGGAKFIDKGTEQISKSGKALELFFTWIVGGYLVAFFVVYMS